MEAKDTVMSPVQQYQAVIGYAHRLGRKINLGTRASDNALCEAQAEISYKAGYHQREIDPLDKEDRCEKCYEQGIREVVDYINNRGIANSFFPVNTRRQWEDQLKEWGIKED